MSLYGTMGPNPSVRRRLREAGRDVVEIVRIVHRARGQRLVVAKRGCLYMVSLVADIALHAAGVRSNPLEQDPTE